MLPVAQPHHTLSAQSTFGCCKVPWLCQMLPALALSHLPEVLGDTVIPPGDGTVSGAQVPPGRQVARRALPAWHSRVWPQLSRTAQCSVLQHWCSSTRTVFAPSAAAALLRVPQNPFPTVLPLFLRHLWTPRAKPPTSLPMALPILAVVSLASAQQEVLGGSGAARPAGPGLISLPAAAGRTQQHMAQPCRHMFQALQDGILQL